MRRINEASSVGGQVGMDVWVNWKMKLKQLLGGFDRNYLLSLLTKNQIFAGSAGRQFFQATRRCFEIVGDSEPYQAAATVPFKEIESGYWHVCLA